MGALPVMLASAALCGAALVPFAARPAHGQAAGLDAPAPVGPFLGGVFPPRTPLAPGSSTWVVEDAFPGLPIENALVIVPNPSDDRLYVGSRDGRVVSFENDEAVTGAELFLDVRDRVALVSEGGLYGLAFHPQFGQPGSPYERTFYAYYSTHCPVDAERDGVDLGACDASYPTGPVPGFFSTWLRLSRFHATWDAGANVWRGDPGSEAPMLSIRLYNWGHRGGGLVFGADGRLHLTIGDQTRHETAQDVVSTLEGGTLRLEVSIGDLGGGIWTCPAGSHLPRRRFQDVSPHPDEVSGRLYCIPDDNPWLDAAGGRFEEYFAIGQRNPYRLSLDPATGWLWSGDVGELSREEINVVRKGGNYGWPFREGLTAGPRPPPAVLLGELTDPVIDFERSEAASLIGGHVYRGSRFPELVGRFLAGDFLTRNLWAITLEPGATTATRELLATFEPGQLVSFGRDNAGEIYMGSIAAGVPLQRLARLGEPVPDPPGLLSELGAFTDLASLAVHPAAVPYDLVPFWSDGAEKRRWIFLPNDGDHDAPEERIAFSESGNWRFPAGTVLMKHFELALDESDPADRARLETRFLVHGEDGRWYGLTYRWRDDESDAELLPAAATRTLEVRRAGGTEPQIWAFPSRSQCTSCHTAAAGAALGVRTHQLNRALTYPRTGRTDNQLRTWSALGMLDPAPGDAQIAGALAGAGLGDVTAPLEHRARSWLDANCAGCHRPGTGNRAAFDARLTTPFALQGLVWGHVLEDLGIPDAYLVHPGAPFASLVWHRVAAVGPLGMPPLAKARADEQAALLLSEWIRRIRPGFPRSGLAYEYYEVGGLAELPDFDALTPTRTGSIAGFDLSVRDRGDDFAFRFRGVVEVPASGSWTFSTTSDDGSQLFVDGALVVDNDGLHAAQERSGTISLGAGFHAIAVTMFERAGGEILAVDWQGPGVAKQAIPASRLYREEPSVEANAPPALASPGPQAGNAGQPVQLALSAVDPDGDLLFFDASGLPAGLALHPDSGEIAGTLLPGSAGTWLVTASASDGSGVSVARFDWIVEPNTPPEAASPAGRLNAVGDVISLPIAASDAEGGPLAFSASGLPLGLSIDPDTGEIAGTLLAAGTHAVVVEVSDGIDATEVAFGWTVRIRRPGIVYEYFEVGGLSALPDFDALAPAATGFVSGFDLSPRERDDGFAFRFTGVLDVPAGGVWTFSTRSDDGSRLFVDGVLVVDNDGRHALQKRSGQLALEAGPHEVVVTMFEWVGGERLEVLWAGPGIAEQAIPASRLFSWTARAPACGLGIELAPLLPGWLWLRRRTRSRGA